MKRFLCILGQQGFALYAQDRYGMIWYRLVPDGEWCPVAH